MKKIRIISVATADYSHFMLAFLKSFIIHSPEWVDRFAFSIHLINCNECFIKSIQDLPIDVEIVRESIPFQNVKMQRIFCTNYRYELLPRYIESSDILWWLDADTLFLNNGSKLFSRLMEDNYDASLYRKPGYWTHKSFKKHPIVMGGNITVGTQGKSREFALEYKKRVEIYFGQQEVRGTRTRRWWANQDVLRMMVYENEKTMKGRFNFLFWGDPYFNTVYKPDTIVYFRDDKKGDPKKFDALCEKINKTKIEVS